MSHSRRRGLIQGGVGLLAASAFALLDHPFMAGIAGGMGLIVVLLATFAPTRLQSFFRGLTEWVGIGLTAILLTPIYLLFFLPFRLLFRSGRRDRLNRQFDSAAASYWQKRTSPAPGAKPFDRQF